SASCLAARQLVQLLDAGCAALTLSLIPPGLDQVLVASVERSRNPELRLVIVLGVNADTLPGCAVPTALLSDHERIKLSHSGIELAPGTVSRQMAEHFLAYIALTRSHEYLLLTYAQSNAQNKALQPSPLIKKLQKIFANLKIERFGEPHTAEELTGNTHTVNLLARHLKNERLGFTMPVFWQEIYNWYAAQESWQPQLKRIEQGLSFRPYAGRLSVENQKSLYGKTIVSSVSRLEKFNACPFAYFAAYILKLGPRPQYEFTALERGEIFHRALAHLSSLLAHNKPGWRELTQQQAAEVVEQVLAELLPNLLSGIMQSTARYRYQASRLQDTLSATLMIIADHIKHGYFVPVAWELPFGNNSASALPPLTIELSLGRKLEITGQIDRVDIAKPANGAAYVRIVDYKSAKRTLTKSDIENGLALQLPVYLETVLAHPQYFHEADLQPAGLYYMAVRDDYTAVSMPPAGQENSASTMRLSGITIKDAHAVRLADPQINGHSKFIPAALSSKGFYASSPGISEEEFREMRLQLTDILCKTAENMAGGLATIEPRRYNGFDACAYCDYRTFCGIDGETMRSLSASIE
ncbi:MAG: PD-(D/E)XK nuclease family protein, partial [Firmicutes bacterium]|nr:PD-(D/E)XK nuclease family protein [Bacillota bacterium]